MLGNVKAGLPISIASLLLLIGGCAQTLPARSIDESGFLSDYSILESGGPDEAQRMYRLPGVDWAAYKNVLLDPVTLWRGSESKARGVSSADAQTLVNFFQALIRKHLEAQGLTIVDAPGPLTLRVQVAITKAKESRVALDVVSTVVPFMRAASGIDRMTTGKPSFVGQAQIEFKVTDSESGQLLAAGVDHRVGGKDLTAMHFHSWGEVETIMRLWASHGSFNLCMLQERSDCVPPPTT